MRRTFARIDVTSRSIFAVVEPESCFAGTLLEMALAADRVYMRDTQESEGAPRWSFENNFGRCDGHHLRVWQRGFMETKRKSASARSNRNKVVSA